MNWDFVGWDSPVAQPTEGVLYLLLIMLVASVIVAAAQAATFHADRKDFRSLIEHFYATLRCSRTRESISLAQTNNAARVKHVNYLRLTDDEARLVPVRDSDVFDLARQSLECSAHLIQSGLRKKQNYLATVSATAAFVGLFGTVTHMTTAAFRGCGAQKSVCQAATISAVADSLRIAVLGMVVAFVAVWFYRFFNGEIEAFSAEMENSSLEFLNALALGLRRTDKLDVKNRDSRANLGVEITFDREGWLKRIKTRAAVVALIVSSVTVFYALRPPHLPQSGFSKYYVPVRVIASAEDQPFFSTSQCRANVELSLEFHPYLYTLDQKGGRWPFGCKNLSPEGNYYWGRWISDDHGAISIGVSKWSLRWHGSPDHIIEENDLDNVSVWTVRIRVPE